MQLLYRQLVYHLVSSSPKSFYTSIITRHFEAKLLQPAASTTLLHIMRFPYFGSWIMQLLFLFHYPCCK